MARALKDRKRKPPLRWQTRVRGVQCGKIRKGEAVVDETPVVDECLYVFPEEGKAREPFKRYRK